MWIANVERSREMDRRAEEEFGIPGKLLMERAGISVFKAVKELLPKGGKITVLCGRGKNGGDGFVVARLAAEHNFHVEVLVAAEEKDLVEMTQDQNRIARASGVEPIFSDDPRWQRKLDCMGSRDAVIDALLGTGAHNEVRGFVKAAIQAINKSGVPVIAIDVPSGLDTNTGEELGESVWAMRTVTMGLPKPFLFQGIGVEHSGYWSVCEIGYPHALLDEPTEARLIDNDWVANLLPERLRSSHKGENGSILIVAGSEKLPGAATMAAKAALRSGAGLVTVAAIPSVCESVAHHLPEVLLLPLPENHGAISADAARVLLAAQSKFHSAVFGPGLSQDEPVHEFLTKVWQEWKKPAVIDADALNAVANGVPLPQCDCVLTPHPGEMGRLLKLSIAELQADRFNTVKMAVEKFRRAVILKGAHTIVGEVDLPMLVNQSGNSGMASGGMGDILSGVIATLLAEDLPGYYAAACGIYWHGYAGDLAAIDIGPIGYTATEVADHLPKARAKITSLCDGC